MFKALLFDLDGTLLPLDLELFIQKYFEKLAPFFAHKIEPEILIKELWTSTMSMLKNSGTLTNEEVFMASFLPAIKQEKMVMYPLFEKFYQEEFPKLQKYSGYSPLSAQIIGQAQEKGYKIVLATNPIFPELAIRHRMQWAGIDNFSWDLVTTYENSRACKPNPLYFRQIIEEIKVSPEECLMVGNDVQEDLVASTLGMKTFLVTDYLIDRGQPLYQPDHRGSLQDLLSFIKELPVLG